MTIRGKLNLTVAILLVVFLATVAVVMQAVNKNVEHTQNYSRMRGRSQFVADLRTDIYQRLAAAEGNLELPAEPERVGWPRYAIDDIDIQIRLSQSDEERDNWRSVGSAIQALAIALETPLPNPPAKQAVAQLKRHLRSLRHAYDLREGDSIVVLATSSFNAQVAIALAILVAILLFFAYLAMVRRWLVEPIKILKNSADAIGEGQLEHRVPLTGGNELAQLARRLDAMAERLAQHQTALLEARELSAIGELCTHVAHGLRNPLAGIRAGVQLIGRRSGSLQEIKDLLGDLILEVDRMDSRIVKLFEFSRPCELRRERLMFSELARAIAAESHPILDSKGVTLAVEDETDNRTWWLDREQLAGALSELTTNAAHHSERGSQVTIHGRSLSSTNGEPERIQVQVMDQGVGMPAPTLRKAFDLFFTARPGGTGMGLAMVRRIVQKHGGVISIDSEPSAGTTVTVTLPAECPPQDGPVESS